MQAHSHPNQLDEMIDWLSLRLTRGLDTRENKSRFKDIETLEEQLHEKYNEEELKNLDPGSY